MARQVVEWPSWPQSSDRMEALAIEAMRSGRWAISELSNGKQPFVRRVETEFARMVGVDCAVMTTSGTSAITIALESLGIEQGSEVLVPGLTWIACASAVLNAGLRPVLVDVDPVTMCMSLDAARRSIGGRTAAVLLVHYMNNHAATDEFVELCRKHQLALIEDCAQAHGAVERGQHVGARGDVGVFSFQASKALTSGEGGALVTNDRTLARRAEQYRADGRAFPAGVPLAGAPDLLEVGDVLGRNLCMSEITAAILLGAIELFPHQQARRTIGAARLDKALSGLSTVMATPAAEGTDTRSYYRYTVRIDRTVAMSTSAQQVMMRLAHLTGVPVEPLHDPLNANAMYRPDQQSSFKWRQMANNDLRPSQYDLPVAAELFKTVVTFPHQILLAEGYALDHLAHMLGRVVTRMTNV